ncbi:unnamed protein product [Gongylonema pulchrum]|uniref:Protein YIPF n=1 Tax=Gongylonema pulchrum TaxID=637853 RepID=A0A183DZ20_9BILA|nr:unnamed protein product [Gongylonema pulchrum]
MSQYWMNSDNTQNNWYNGWNEHSSTSASQVPPYYYGQQELQPGDNYYATKMFVPSQQQSDGSAGDNFENELPLLEELGINFSHIRQKTIAVLNPVGSVTPDAIADQDLAGPLVFCLLFGAALLLHGKVQFGYIYGIGALGCVGMYALLNLMAADNTISFTCTASGVLGYLVASAAVLWCSISSSKLFVTTLSMDGQRLLVAYPCALLYCVFALLAIF